MAIQPIPIKLQPATVPTGLTAANLQELLVLIARYMSAGITEDIGFFRFGNSLPLTNVGPFYRLSDNKYYQWNSTLGRYVCDIGTAAPLDVFYSYNDADDNLNGWVVADGRPISSLTGLTTRQRAVLEGEWGAGGNLPNLRQNLVVPIAGSVPAVNNSAPDNIFYYLLTRAPYRCELVNVSFQTNTGIGTITAEVRRNGAVVTGLGAIPCTESIITSTPTDPTIIEEGESVTVILSARTAPANTLYFTLVVRPTVQDAGLVGRIYVGTP